MVTRSRTGRFRFGYPVALSFLLVASLLIPARGGSAAEQPPGTESPTLASPAPPPGPVGERQRVPVPAPFPEGLRGLESTAPVPEGPPEEDPGLRFRPKLGGPNFDVFSVKGAGTHTAVVYPDDVNVRDADGRWVAAEIRLVPQGSGWAAELEDASVTFPGAVGGGSEVVFQIDGDAVSSSLEGAGKTQGEEAEGQLLYRGVLPGTDVVLAPTPHGYKEDLVLGGPEAPTGFSYLIDAGGLDLVPGEGGRYVFLRGQEEVAVIPTPVAYDSSPGMADSVPATTLTDLGGGRYRLGIELDQAYLATATYPVRVDPGTTTLDSSRDTWVNKDASNTNYDGGTFLKVGAGKRTFVRFKVGDFLGPDRLVYVAQLKLWVENQATKSDSVNANRPNQEWPVGNDFTWNTQPTVAAGSYGSGTGPTDDWLRIDLASLYQEYLNQIWPNRGIRLGSADDKVFLADEWGNFKRPHLVLTWNDLPSAPTLQSPGADAELHTDSPTLAATSTDPNGDAVLLNYEVSDSATDFTGSHVVWTSGWTDEERITVPPGILGGGAFWWRVQARDVCTPPDGLCSLTDGAGVTRPVPTSSAQGLTVALEHLGRDERYAMWSRELGNDMSLEVNQANGNLLLGVPLDSLGTPAGDLDLSMAYNHQQDEDFGLGAGWDVSAGPESFSDLAPSELTEVTDPGVPAGEVLAVRSRTGAVSTFTKRSEGVFRSSGADAAAIHQSGDGSYALATEEGDDYTFAPNGDLVAAEPAAASPQDDEFRYTFNAGGHVTRVEDALGRAVQFSWNVGQLAQVATWDGRTWQFTYEGGRMASVTNPAGETVSFLYDVNGRLSEVRDGQQTADGAPGWGIDYGAAAGDPLALPRVSAVRPPAPPGARWEFAYVGPFYGAVASQAQVTDPRGVASATADDYQIRTDFSKYGFPIRVAGPADQHGYWPLTTRVWDSNGNLLCERTAEANAVAEHCTATLGTSDSLSTVYTYDPEDSSILTEVRQPAPNPDGSGPRAVETYRYDEGTAFQGLWREAFANPALAGLPAAQVVSGDLGETWGLGSPPGISQGDGWGLRWTGVLQIGGTAAKTYQFRIASEFDHADDRVRIAIDNTTLVDCSGTPKASGVACPGNDASRLLTPGPHPVSIVFAEGGGQASFRLEWKPDSTFLVMQPTDFEPELELRTTTTTPDVAITEKYAGNDSMAQRLASSDVSLDPETQKTQESGHAYDPFGRATAETVALGTTQEATITTTSYTDDIQAGTSCETRTVDSTGAVAEFACDQAGRVARVTQHVRAVGSQPAQERITLTMWDGVGRVTVEDRPEGGRTETTYDLAGRPIVIRERIIDGGTQDDPSDDVFAVTQNQYDPASRLVRETLPDPDGEGPLTPPVIEHAYDAAGNEIQRTDARGKMWQTAYDASDRVIAETTPTGLVTATDHELSALGAYVHRTTVTDPSGVATVTRFDVLGRETSERVGTFQPTTFEYDDAGNLVRTTDPAGVWTDENHDGFGQLLEERTPSGDPAGPAAVTTHTYDAAGNLVGTDGPRTDVNDSLAYTYDLSGRLTSATQSGIAAPNTTQFVYDDVGELVKVVDPEGRVRQWTFDEAGREKTHTDTRGTTTSLYNAAGWLVTKDDPRGIQLRFSYDRLGRQTRRWAQEGAQEKNAESFSYDAEGNMTSATVEASQVGTTLTYEGDGRLVEVAQGGDVTAVQYGPSAPGKITSITDPTGGVTAYAYDQNGLLKTLTDPLSGQNTTYDYNAASGRPASRTDPTGLAWSRTYDAAGRVDSQVVSGTAGQVASFGLAYDRAGNVVRKDQTVTGAPPGENGTWTYGYDGASRLIAATDPGSVATTYAYDGASNRTEEEEGTAAAVTTTYDQAGLPVSSSDGTTYAHDAVGNLTSVDGPGPDWSYGYDAWRRMTSANGPSSITFAYDALSRVTQRTEGTATTTYRYVGETENPASVTEGVDETLYAHSPGGPLAQKVNGEVRFLLSDLHEDVVGLVDMAGQTTATRSYSPWGEVRASGGEETLFGFQGDPTDPDTGLVDMVTRFYEPALGRFTTRDVVFGDSANPTSLNLFVYAWDTPVTLADPEGMYPVLGGGNPWGCRAKAWDPHFSDHAFAKGKYKINAMSTTKCHTRPPPDARWQIAQKLFRSSWHGWIQVAPGGLFKIFRWKNTWCGGSRTRYCRPRNMRAFIQWGCPRNSKYNYRLTSVHFLYVGGRIAMATDSYSTGPWWQTGRIRCSPY